MTNHSTGIVNGLLSPQAYVWRPDRVELIETHISWVFLAGHKVVKIKRPVRFPFVDHTSLAMRQRSCDAEVLLNRRLTADVYVGVEPVTFDGDNFALSGAGQAVDYATVMRRLPADRMLDRLIAAGGEPSDLDRLLADRLIPFHMQVAQPCGAQEFGAVAQANVVTANLDEVAQFAGNLLCQQVFQRVAVAMRDFLEARWPLFEERVAGGWVRDGHGDLRTEHFCIEPGDIVQVYDCVEFNTAIRCADIASDLAYLLVDLERLGRDVIGERLLQRYRQAGAILPPELVEFYRAHRSLVKAKIDCLTLSRGGALLHPGQEQDASDWLARAFRAAFVCKPVVIMMSGLSGTGKSVVAGEIARLTGATVITADRVRKDLAGLTGRATAAQVEVIYTAEWTNRTYTEMFRQAAVHLAAGRPVILDGTFLDTELRTAAANLANEFGMPTLLIEVVAGEETVAHRLQARTTSGAGISDAGWSVYLAQRERLQREQIRVPAGVTSVTVNTSAGEPPAVGVVLDALDGMELLVRWFA